MRAQRTKALNSLAPSNVIKCIIVKVWLDLSLKNPFSCIDEDLTGFVSYSCSRSMSFCQGFRSLGLLWYLYTWKRK